MWMIGRKSSTINIIVQSISASWFQQIKKNITYYIHVCKHILVILLLANICGFLLEKWFFWEQGRIHENGLGSCVKDALPDSNVVFYLRLSVTFFFLGQTNDFPSLNLFQWNRGQSKLALLSRYTQCENFGNTQRCLHNYHLKNII